MHLSWSTSRQHIQCLRRATQVLEYLAPALLTYAAPFATATGGLNSLPVEPTVYRCTFGEIYIGISYIYPCRWHQHCTLHPTFSGYMRRHHQCPCTCACHGVHRAGISSVLRRASTSTGVLRACVFSLCRTFATATGSFNSLPVVPTVYTCTCGGVHRAGTSSLCCTCACHGVHRANWDARAQFLDSVVIFPMSQMKLDLLCAHGACACQILRILLGLPGSRLCLNAQPVSKTLHVLSALSWCTSHRLPAVYETPVVEYFAPVPSVLLHLRLSWCTSRWHQQCQRVARRMFRVSIEYWITWRQRL